MLQPAIEAREDVVLDPARLLRRLTESVSTEGGLYLVYRSRNHEPENDGYQASENHIVNRYANSSRDSTATQSFNSRPHCRRDRECKKQQRHVRRIFHSARANTTIASPTSVTTAVVRAVRPRSRGERSGSADEALVSSL